MSAIWIYKYTQNLEKPPSWHSLNFYPYTVKLHYNIFSGSVNCSTLYQGMLSPTSSNMEAHYMGPCIAGHYNQEYVIMRLLLRQCNCMLKKYDFYCIFTYLRCVLYEISHTQHLECILYSGMSYHNFFVHNELASM